MNIELKATITQGASDIIDINGFSYKVYRIRCGGLEDFKALFPISTDMFVGDCFITTNWKVARIGLEKDPVDLCIRVDEHVLADSKEFTPSEYLISKLRGVILKSDKCAVKKLGPDRKKFIMATIRIKDPAGPAYDMILVAFGQKAEELSEVPKCSSIECEVTIKARLKSPGYELALNILK